MANEATVNTSLIIKKGTAQDYRSAPTQFKANVTDGKGPSPGAIAVTKAGVDIDLSELGTPSLARFQNMDLTDRIAIGIYDGATFYPMIELLAGETFVLRLSQELTGEYTTGTGTTGASINTLRAKCFTSESAVLLAEIFNL